MWLSDRSLALIAILISIIALIPGAFDIYQYFSSRETRIEITALELSTESELQVLEDDRYPLAGRLVLSNISERAVNVSEVYCRNTLHRGFFDRNGCSLEFVDADFPTKIEENQSLKLSFRMSLPMSKSAISILDSMRSHAQDVSISELRIVLQNWFGSDPLSEFNGLDVSQLFFESLEDNRISDWSLVPSPLGSGVAQLGQIPTIEKREKLEKISDIGEMWGARNGYYIFDVCISIPGQDEICEGLYVYSFRGEQP
jgi:hypothetical protein